MRTRTETETEPSTRFSGRGFTPSELTLIQEVVASCAGLSRKELAHTVCELLGWRRPSGALKARQCREFLERVAAGGTLALPAKALRRPVGSRTRVPVTARGERGRDLSGDVSAFAPIEVEAVEAADQRLLFRELLGRHHYLGHTVPFGAQLRYLVYASRPSARWWGACSSRARRGGWRRATSGSAGTTPRASATCSGW